MSALAQRNLESAHRASMRTGTRGLEVAPVKVIVMPGYSVPSANDRTMMKRAEPKRAERPGAWFVDSIRSGRSYGCFLVSRRNPALMDSVGGYEDMLDADGNVAVFTSAREARAAIALAGDA
ncbi:hypothetical protein [Dyella caseinilytica]|uniref:Uncharacterized protein n=1 Tax=Dyella caseinilytica TaxID=1849581 RepID=A0ABX7GRH6_9GAMM|nr:hypothetical protein [Dyella caseinilytica]QRN52422.1 hypothetical protein ISN74_13145 [Dyella caseinilytica]GGA05831.1 hypothetical protein GCM10011408_28490 [Dyella caseinilytica]